MGSAARMREQMERLLEELPQDKIDMAQYDFDGPERTEWSYFPKEMIGSSFFGLPMLELTPPQQQMVHAMIETGVSPYAFAKIHAIRSFEPTLLSTESYKTGNIRESLRYYLAIFGEPGATGTWGWRFEGHHVSVNHTIVDDEVLASTPLFFGSNPGEIRRGDRGVIRPNGEEEDAGRALVTSLDADRFDMALLDATAPIDVLTAVGVAGPRLSHGPENPEHPLDFFQVGARRAWPRTRKTTSPWSSPTRRASHMPTSTAVSRRRSTSCSTSTSTDSPITSPQPEVARIDAAGRDQLHFAWAGDTKRLGPHYYRIQGPDLLIEYDCVQDDANHIHGVWRRPDSDFGGDPLRAHRANGH